MQLIFVTMRKQLPASAMMAHLGLDITKQRIDMLNKFLFEPGVTDPEGTSLKFTEASTTPVKLGAPSYRVFYVAQDILVPSQSQTKTVQFGRETVTTRDSQPKKTDDQSTQGDK